MDTYTHYVGWARKALYHKAMTSGYSGTFPSGTGFIQLRETSGGIPIPLKPVNDPVPSGSGLAYPVPDEVNLGREELVFPITMPMTELAMRDALVLLWQGSQVHTADPIVISSPAGQVVVEGAATGKCCGMYVGLTAATTAYFGYWGAHSCIPSQIDITIPQAGPNDIIQLALQMIGKKGEKLAAATTLTTPSRDTGNYLHARDASLLVWTGAAYAATKILEAKLTLTNSAYLSPECGSDNPSSIMLGPWGLTGTLKTWLKDGAGEIGQMLYDSAAAGSIVRAKWRFVDSTNEIIAPMICKSMGQPTKVGPSYAADFAFFLAGTVDGSTAVPSAIWSKVVGGSAASPYA